MTDLSRDARALLARARRRDGPSSADRERIRKQLDQAWHPSREPEPEAPASSTVVFGRLQPWAAAVLLLSIGFLAPEAPRPVELSVVSAPAPVQAAAVAVPAVRAEATSSPRPQPLAPAFAPQPTAPPRAPARTSVASAGPRAVRRAKNGANRAAPAESTLPGAPQPAARRDANHVSDGSSVPAHLPLTAAVAPAPVRNSTSEAPLDGAAEPAPPRQTASGDTAPVQRRRDFEPQPIAEELAWVGAAQEALRGGQPSRALKLVQEHAFRFPRGALAPERVAVQALALCALQRRAAARQVIANLSARAPGSPLLNRVRRECRLSP